MSGPVRRRRIGRDQRAGAVGAAAVEDAHGNVAARPPGRIVLGCSTLAPKYASSDASANDRCGTTRGAVDDARVGGQHAVDVGPDLNLARVERRRRRAPRSSPTRRGRASSSTPSRVAPTKPPSTGTRPASTAAARSRAPAAACVSRGQRRCRRVRVVGDERAARIDPGGGDARVLRAPRRRGGCSAARRSTTIASASAATPRAGWRCAFSSARSLVEVRGDRAASTSLRGLRRAAGARAPRDAAASSRATPSERRPRRARRRGRLGSSSS